MEMVSKKVVCVALLCMVVMAATAPRGAEAALSCGQVVTLVSPCINYLRGPGVSPPPPCCNGIRTLNAQAKTTPDRQTACNCLKSSAASIKGLNFGKAAGLPSACGVPIPYKISPSTDCKRVQ